MDAAELFAPLGPGYDRWGSVLSFGQDPRWRRFLVSRIDAGPTDTVLDVATGTAAVALELVRQKDCFVIGVDRTPQMLEEGRAPRRARGRRRARSGCRKEMRDRFRSRTVCSTRSRSPTCCATWTTPRRRCASSRASSSPAARSQRSSSASRAVSGGRSGSSGRALGCRRPAVVIGNGWHEVGSFCIPRSPSTTRHGRSHVCSRRGATQGSRTCRRVA